MSRITTKEIHERNWCPELFRDSLTEFLSIIWAIGVYEQAMSRISFLVRALNVGKVVDLCSGAGDYIPKLLKKIKSEDQENKVVIYKTDLYPNKRFFETGDEQIKYWQESVPADKAFEKFNGLFCMFSALHHFDEPDLLKIFYRAAKNNRCFSFFDISQRRFFTDILPNIFLPPMLWCTAPFFKRFTWKHFLFIYLLPVIPLIVCIDGTLSRMRAYKKKELQELIDRIQKQYPDYHIKITEYKLMGGIQKITEVTGCPKSAWKVIEEFKDQVQKEPKKS